eukprot:6081549-Ditylum_brightwellii.AAC.1
MDNPVSPYAATKKCMVHGVVWTWRHSNLSTFGDCSSSHDYTYITDIVGGVVCAIDCLYPCEIYNLGKGDGTSLREFICLAEKYTGRKAIIRQLLVQAGDVPYT